MEDSEHIELVTKALTKELNTEHHCVFSIVADTKKQEMSSVILGRGVELLNILTNLANDDEQFHNALVIVLATLHGVKTDALAQFLLMAPRMGLGETDDDDPNGGGGLH